MEKISDLSNFEYHHGKYKKYISSSDLKNILVSPKYFKAQKEIIRESSSSMKLGTAVHSALLEPENFTRDIAIMPEIKGTGSVKKKHEFHKENSNKTIITESQNKIVDSIVERFVSTPELKHLFSGGEAEVSIFWENWKIRPDYFKTDLVIDLKTTSKPLSEFSKACANYKYDLSAWFYKFGAGGSEYKFVVVETNPPYDFVIYEPDVEFMHEGREKCLIAMDIYRDCKKYDIWPGVELTQTLSLPKWYIGGYNEHI